MSKRRGKNKSIMNKLLAICISLILAVSGIISVSALAINPDDFYIASEGVADATETPVEEGNVSEEPMTEEPVAQEKDENDDNELDQDVMPVSYSGGLNEITVTNAAEFDAALADLSVDVIVIDGVVNSSATVFGGRELTIRGGTLNIVSASLNIWDTSVLTLDGVIVRSDFNNAVISVTGESTLNLYYGTEISGTGFGIVVTGNATVNIYDGVVISDNSHIGVFISGNVATTPTVNMYGGLITRNGNIGRNGDAGVAVSNGDFNMFGGTISENSSSHGGGVIVASSTFNMEGGEIRDNQASNAGGGVRIASGTFNMEGGTIRDNVADGGAGVLVEGTFNMEGGEIIGNSADVFGGGVHVATGGTFTMTGGKISENSSNHNGGGGVNVMGSATFEMKGGEISRNMAMVGIARGGGVRVEGFNQNPGHFIMRGGEITENISAQHGGGVHLSGPHGGIFTMYDGTINGNTSRNGGGVNVDAGRFTMNGGEIINNTASNDGGGIYVNVFQSITISPSAVFAGNTASIAFWLEDFGTDLWDTYKGLFAYEIAALPNIAWSSLSDSGSPIPFSHLANNYDLNLRSFFVRAAFHPNGGDGDPEVTWLLLNNILAEDNIPAFIRDNHNFTGWNIAADGSGEEFDKTEPIRRNVDVFAQWESIGILDSEPNPEPNPSPNPNPEPNPSPDPNPNPEPNPDPNPNPEPNPDPNPNPEPNPNPNPNPEPNPDPDPEPGLGGGTGGSGITPPATGELVPDDNGTFIELDDSGVPLGTWTWDTDEEMWIFDPVVPLSAMPQANMPQTGLANLAALFASLIGLSFVIAASAFVMIKREKAKNLR